MRDELAGARADERAKIVAWLEQIERLSDDDSPKLDRGKPMPWMMARAVRIIADAIERGDHESAGEKT